MQKSWLALVGLALALAGAAQAQVQIYGAIGGCCGTGGQLFTINPATAATTTIGATGLTEVDGMAFHPNGTLYATGANATGNPLVRINTSTGAATVVGFTGVNSMSDIAFRSDGALFGFVHNASAGADGLYSINITTGVATLIATLPSISGTNGGGNALAFNAASTLLLANGLNLRSLNQTTAAPTLVTALTYAVGFGGGARANAMKFHPTSGVLYASVVSGGDGGGAFSLGTIDPASGAVARIGALPLGTDALAIGGTSAPLPPTTPAPSSWLMLVTGLAAVLGWSGWRAARRLGVR